MTVEEGHFVGVDVGGTKILALAVTAAGEILGRKKSQTVHDGTPMVDQISAAIDAVLEKAELTIEQVAGIGVAMPGSVDSSTGYLGTVPNIEIDDYHLVDTLRERYPIPVEIGNDVNLGTLAECWLGAGRDAQTVVGMFVGTGIGGGVVVDGRLHTGSEDLAGEIGHMVLMIDGPECGCGNLGCFEAIASRTAMEKAIRQGIADGRISTILELSGGDRIKSGAIEDALDAGDELVTEVMSKAAHVLAQGILTIRHLLNPDMVILGGGVIEACEDFLVPLIKDDVRQSKMKGSRDSLQIAVSQLGDDAVALGAAALAEATVSDLPVYAMSQPSVGPEEGPPEYPTIDAVEFGSVTVGGERWEKDIHIRADGRVKKRKKKWAREEYGTSHVVGPREIAKALKKGGEMLIIGEGFDCMVELADEGREMLKQRGVRWQILPTPAAVEVWNEAEGPKALILHVTC